MQRQFTSLLGRLFALALTGLALVTLSGCATQSGTDGTKITVAANEQIIMEEFMVPSGDAGINLYVRNKRLKSTTSFNKDNVVLFVHGATYPSETGFDLRLDGLSWMDVMAQQGYDVYLVDIRGYGKSTRPAIMDQPAADNKPFADSDTAARDYAAAADWVRKRRNVEKLNVVGHSWGTVITALYTTRHADKVNR